MKITYLFNSSFLLENNKTAVILDYFPAGCSGKYSFLREKLENDTLISYENVYVLSSHSHRDHFDSKIFEWEKINKNIKYILSYDIFEEIHKKQENISYLKEGKTYKLDDIFIRAFGSTDIGISFYIELGNKKIFHAGDLNNWHWREEAAKEESEGYEKHYLEELEKISAEIDYLDVLIFPTDPNLRKDYTLGAEQFLEKIKVNTFIPMHFRNDYLAGLNFETYVTNKGLNFFKIKDRGDFLELY